MRNGAAIGSRLGNRHGQGGKLGLVVVDIGQGHGVAHGIKMASAPADVEGRGIGKPSKGALHNSRNTGMWTVFL